MDEWGEIKMTTCPRCGGLMVENGSCRACADYEGVEPSATSGGGARGVVALHAPAREAAKSRSSLPLVLGGGGLLSLLVVVLVYAFLWSGTGGLVSTPRVQLYLSDLAKLQLDVQQVSRELVVVKAVLPGVEPSTAASAIVAANTIENAAAAWKERESPSGDLAGDHAALLASLRQLAEAAGSVRTALQSGDAGLLYKTIAAFEARQAEFSLAASRLMERGARGG